MNFQKVSPLSSKHLNLGARLASFSDWQMPLFYTSIIDEYKHCRQSIAIFDIFHMGEIIFEGDIEKSGIEKAVTPWLKRIPVGRGAYGFILNKQAGVIDDLIVFKIRQNKLLFVTNAASQDLDYKLLKERINSGRLENISAQTAKIDLQGPLAREVLRQTLGFELNIPYFNFAEFNYKHEKILISRTGYTGELGYEIFIPKRLACFIWDKFISNKKVKPAGLGARDILRLEMGYSLLGNELNETITPLEAGLGKFINFAKDFVGRDALLNQKNQGIDRIKIAFTVSSRRIPRFGYKIYFENKQVGEVTSGTFSPLLSSGIGLGYIKRGYQKHQRKIVIGDGKKISLEAEIVNLPFYKRGSLKS